MDIYGKIRYRKIVYFKDWLSLTCYTCDSVLYDFNMEIGDSLINSSYFVSHMLYSYVYAIDSILIDGLFRKRFVLEDEIIFLLELK